MSTLSQVQHDVPERSIQQRMSALQHANHIRTYRASLKRDLKAGRVNIQEVLLNPSENVDTMKVVDLLMAVPKLGRVKIDKMVRSVPMSYSKTVGGMSERQRGELLAMLRRR